MISQHEVLMNKIKEFGARVHPMQIDFSHDGLEEFLAARDQEVIAAFLERTGQYVTNDASREAAIADALASRDAAPSEALSPATVAQPVGWQLVPMEPTESMLKAGNAKTWPLPSKYVYSAMLNAAPVQPCASQGCGGAVSETVYALKWCAAALQALVESRGESGSINMIVSGEKKSLEDVLDLADAALSTAKSGGGATPEGGEA